MSATNDAAARTLQSSVQNLWPGLQCRWRDSVTSTSTLLSELARSPGFEPTLLVADEQTHGRGRLGRLWESEPGTSLTFSMALPLTVSDWSGLSLAVGVALVESMTPSESAGASSGAPTSAPTLRLKWPNDLWLVEDEPGNERVGRKLGGILIESVGRRPDVAGRSARVAIIGIGLNLHPRRAVAVSTGYASLSEIWPALPEVDALAVLQRIVPALLVAIRQFTNEGFAAFADRFARHDLLLGRSVRLFGGNGEAVGTARGVDANGALLMETRTGIQRVVSGEVSVRLEPSQSASESPAPAGALEPRH